MRTRALACLLGALAVAGCQRGGEAPAADQRTAEIDSATVRAARTQLPPAVRAQLDSGNAAFKAEDYQGALRHYRAAARLDERAPAAWFGVYMAENALGNSAAADAAIARARAIAPDATLMRPGAAPAAADSPAARSGQ